MSTARWKTRTGANGGGDAEYWSSTKDQMSDQHAAVHATASVVSRHRHVAGQLAMFQPAAHLRSITNAIRKAV